VETFDKKIENIRHEATMRTLEFLNLYGTDKHLENAIHEQGSPPVGIVPLYVSEEQSTVSAAPQSLPGWYNTL
jgi:hypothetical protein